MTTTKAQTLQTLLDDANPNVVADCLRSMKLGTMLFPLKVTVAGAVAAAAFDLTTLKVGDGVTTVNSGPQWENGQALPAALGVRTLRVVAGAAAAGPRIMTDSGGAADATHAKISDDGKTLTFEANVTGFVIEYMPRSASDMGAAFGSDV